MNYKIIIPARLDSTRLAKKLLRKINNIPLINYVIKKAKQTKANEIILTTDSTEIAKTVASEKIKTLVLDDDFKSGTDRIAATAEKLNLKNDEVILNIQGDEPLICPSDIDKLAKNLIENKDIMMNTLYCNFNDQNQIKDNSKVKVILDNKYFAIYFSRAQIPCPKKTTNIKEENYYKHIGVYGYRASFLKKFVMLKQGNLEKIESLEQLRAIENGYKIKCIFTKNDHIGIDTIDDFTKTEKLLKTISTSPKHFE